MDLDTNQMQQAPTFIDAGWDFQGENENGTEDIWYIHSQGGYPELSVFLSRLEGEGTPDDPYLVKNVRDWEALLEDPCASYRLTTDIDLEGVVYQGSPIPIYYGHFDGNGHTISNLTIEETGDNESMGLFGVLEPQGNVQHIILENVRINGGQGPTSTLIGRNKGMVFNCHIEGNLTHAHTSGGLVGYNMEGRIAMCSAIVDIYGYGHIGGLVGRNTGIILNSTALGALSGVGAMGGLVGTNNGYILNSYAQVDVTSVLFWYHPAIGGLVGHHSGSLLNCYATGQVADAEIMGGLIGKNEGGGSHWVLLGCTIQRLG